ncbi:hypothetical protein B0T20DRAFT_452066 [Sordaria brevicollis]|uniref:Uncharacterized protein n=1 Tax=Sordaria brevicollis TaxID=83679 RepID=A0AAE0PH53_SORBR|nr:hypothetical protein B0T20DRAFT_452066 [Sordaria brevicollis]
MVELRQSLNDTDCPKSAFKVQVKVGGVNIIQHQHTTKDGGKKQPQDYFVVSEQEWIWGTQVDKDTARQFRVFGRKRERQVISDTTSETSTLADSSHDHEPSDQQQFNSFSSTSSTNRHPQPPHLGEESPHEMVIGTGGLIRQVIHPDKQPDSWTEDPDSTITLRFKIFNPTKPNHFRKITGLELGNPGGNWNDKPNPAKKFFGRQKPVVENPEEMRGDIRSPEEIGSDGEDDEEVETDDDDDDNVDSDLDSGVAMGRAEDLGEEEENDEQARGRFAALFSEAQNQRRERPKKEKRKKKKKGKKDEKPSGLYLMVVNEVRSVKTRGPEKRSRWRKILEAVRRVLSPGLMVA